MKVGDNIKEIREVEKNFKRSYVAKQLGISERAFANIENNVADITLKRLAKIAEIFECSPEYILNYKSAKREFYNHFHNQKGNEGVNIMYQGRTPRQCEGNEKLLRELLDSERKRIALLEVLLKQNNIKF